jgi:hypothetical protein
LASRAEGFWVLGFWVLGSGFNHPLAAKDYPYPEGGQFDLKQNIENGNIEY